MKSSNFESTVQQDLERFRLADEYTLRHLAAHSVRAGQHNRLYELLTRNKAWMQAKFERFSGDQALKEDLSEVLGSFPQPISHHKIITLGALYTVLHLIHERAISYSDEDLNILINLGRKSEALSYARMHTEPQKRFNSLFTVYQNQRVIGYDHRELLLELRRAAFEILDLPNKAEALAKVGEFSEARDVAWRIDGEYWQS